jgi:hypothetical protein
MITAEMLQTLTTFTAPALSKAINLAGFKKDSFNSAKFIGMTNANQFCYRTTYTEHGEEQETNVFLTYDPTVGKVTADY